MAAKREARYGVNVGANSDRPTVLVGFFLVKKNPSKNKNHVHRKLKGIPDNDGYGSLPIVYGGVL